MAEVDETYVTDVGSAESASNNASGVVLNQRTLTNRSPSTGAHTFAVTNELRMTFLENGLPAVGADVLVSSADPPAAWRGNTDSAGRVRIVIPRNDPWIAARLSTGYGNVRVEVNRSAGLTGSTGSIPGAVAFMTSSIGLGDPDMLVDAVNLEIQDKAFDLRPITRDFLSTTFSSDPCAPGQCGNVVEDEYKCHSMGGAHLGGFTEICYFKIGDPFYKPTLIHRNFGSGFNTYNNHKYQISKVTSSATQVSVDLGPWVSTEGGSTTEKARLQNSAPSTYPQQNFRTYATWEWQLERVRTCHNRLDGQGWVCHRDDEPRPLDWTGNYYPAAESLNRHDTYDGLGCKVFIPYSLNITPEEGGLYLATSRGRFQTYSLGLGWDPEKREPIDIKAVTKFSKSVADKGGSEYRYFHFDYNAIQHYAWVPVASVEPEAAGACPKDNPGVTWTMTEVALLPGQVG